MAKRFQYSFAVVGLMLTFLMPAQRAESCMGAFATGYGNLFTPGIITASVGGAVGAAGIIGCCACGCCAVCSGAKGSAEGAVAGGLGMWGSGFTVVLGVLVLVPGIILLDEGPTGFQFGELSERDAARFTANQVMSYHESLPYVNAVVQKIDQHASSKDAALGLKIWNEFKSEFEDKEAIKVVEILSQDLINIVKNLEHNDKDEASKCSQLVLND